MADACPKCGEDRLITRSTDAGRETAYCDVCAHQWRPGSYDDHQLALTLRACTECGGEWYMRTDVCLWCRGERVRPGRG